MSQGFSRDFGKPRIRWCVRAQTVVRRALAVARLFRYATLKTTVAREFKARGGTEIAFLSPSTERSLAQQAALEQVAFAAKQLAAPSGRTSRIMPFRVHAFCGLLAAGGPLGPPPAMIL